MHAVFQDAHKRNAETRKVRVAHNVCCIETLVEVPIFAANQCRFVIHNVDSTSMGRYTSFFIYT